MNAEMQKEKREKKVNSVAIWKHFENSDSSLIRNTYVF